MPLTMHDTIEYIHTIGGRVVRVRLNGKAIGEIRLEASIESAGWRYFPKGQKTGGELFSSLSACKRSLGEDN